LIRTGRRKVCGELDFKGLFQPRHHGNAPAHKVRVRMNDKWGLHTERERERHTHTYAHKERERHIHTQRRTDRQTHIQREREKDTHTYAHRERERERETHTHTHGAQIQPMPSVHASHILACVDWRRHVPKGRSKVDFEGAPLGAVGVVLELVAANNILDNRYDDRESV
jgi:hypothetical protein